MSPRLAALALLLGIVLAPAALAGEETVTLPPRPVVEVVFVLDTTGSMSGLIAGAKSKIWRIANEIACAEPMPRVRFGLVPYRDRGDEYVTQIYHFTGNVDVIHSLVSEMTAEGGGDTPESVNQALHEAVTEFAWSRGDRALRIIYLVGDSPPHMNYRRDVKYPETCRLAKERGIFINTIQCGENGDTTRFWKEIASKAGGRYARVDASGGMVAMKSPFDEKLAEFDERLSLLAVFYGSPPEREEAERALAAADEAARTGTSEAAAERAGYRSRVGEVSARDVITMLECGDVKLEDLDPKLFPEPLQDLEPKVLERKLNSIRKARNELRTEIDALAAKRRKFLRDQLDGTGEDSFDAKVLDALRRQGKKVGLDFGE